MLDVNHSSLKVLDHLYRGQLQTRISNSTTLEESVYQADLVIGAVLIPGGRAPWLITRDMLHKMLPCSVIVDVAVDQGGCVETTKPTTHSQPTYEIESVVHHCVANMPGGAVPRTTTFALNNQTEPYVLQLAEQGLEALLINLALRHGLNTYRGAVTCATVAEAFELQYVDSGEALRN